MMIPIEAMHINWQDMPTIQSGRGIIGYRGSTRYQRGNGIGSFLRSLFKIARPVARRVLKTVAKEGMDTAKLVGADLLQGEDLETSLKTRAKKGVTNIIRRVAKATRTPVRPKRKGYKRLRNQKGAGRVGYKKKPKARKRRRQVGYGRKKYKKGKAKRKPTYKKTDYLGLVDKF